MNKYIKDINNIATDKHKKQLVTNKKACKGRELNKLKVSDGLPKKMCL